MLVPDEPFSLEEAGPSGNLSQCQPLVALSYDTMDP